MQFGFGQPVLRKEDRRLLTGAGRFADDLQPAGAAHAVVLRSPHAHATIRGIDVAAASGVPGVLGIFTGADLAADGIGDLPCEAPIANRNGRMMWQPPRPALARERVRHVGDPVALVVADSLAAARDAADLVAVDYAELASVTETAAALAADAPRVWDRRQGNLAVDWETGDAKAVKAAFAKAAHVVELNLVNNRIVTNALEPRVAIGDYEAAAGRFTLHTPSQGVHGLQEVLADAIFAVPADRIRVVTGDVGGGFGTKLFLYPEHVLVLYAARKLGRTVKWTGTRADSFQADAHARDHVTHAALALDAEGRFLGLRIETVANLGAYLSAFGPYIATSAGIRMLSGVYALPAIRAAVRCVYTNTVPIDAYRGAGRPEAIYVIERLADAAARRLGIGPDEIRRRNFIPALPYRTALGATYDSGAFAAALDKALAAADWPGFAARRDEAAARGRLRGIGLAYYVEECAGGGFETAELRFAPDRRVALLIGTQSNGQGHETAYAQLVAEGLGVPFDAVEVVQGDSDRIAEGYGTGGSRSIPVGGAATAQAVDAAVAKGREAAADMLEAAPADITFADGRFAIAGTDRSVGLFAVADAARDKGDGLDVKQTFTAERFTYPNGCHVCELEVDPDTGQVRLLRYSIVDDFGRVLNPMLLQGQVHGGTAQGIGQALLERCVYEPGSGQLLSGSFMDYCLPRATDMPPIAFATNNVPCATHPLGLKGAGEAGAVGAPPAVINALLDALAPRGVSHIDMPATPEAIWRALNKTETA
jgi:carbon-monoxide dehydrogenase large subunit